MKRNNLAELGNQMLGLLLKAIRFCALFIIFFIYTFPLEVTTVVQATQRITSPTMSPSPPVWRCGQLRIHSTVAWCITFNSTRKLTSGTVSSVRMKLEEARDLSSVDRNKAPLIIAAGHRPWYISAKNESGTVCEDCRKVFEPIFLKHGVDLVLSGRTHLYERNAPIRTFNADPNPNGLNNPSAPWYITNGAAGHYDGLDSLSYPLQP
ncbi:hypothetical protein AFLA_011879 [Aspergillus flavus NRRL3357]|nr:hypothetical protein AFLA_011879 [Aspergillus flavus NRRL3357]